jgi:hypothetical protein
MYDFLFIEDTNGVWRTNKIRNIELVAIERNSEWTCEAYIYTYNKRNLSFCDERYCIINQANSMEDICLQLQCNYNKLYDWFKDEDFSVNYTETPRNKKLEFVGIPVTIQTNNSNSILPEVHVPKKFSLKSN